MRLDSTLYQLVSYDLRQNLIPMLLGEPGIGKSSWVEQLARSMNTKCFTLACNQLADKADLTGARLVPTGADSDGDLAFKQMFYPHAVISEAIEYARMYPNENPILFLDEINRTTPDVTSEALSIPTMRAIGSVSLPDNLRVVLAGNDKGNVTSLDEASVSRFVLYHVDPDLKTFLSVNKGLNEYVRKTLEDNPHTLFCKTTQEAQESVRKHQETDDELASLFSDIDRMDQITTPRTVTAVSHFLNMCDPALLEQMANTESEQFNDMSLLHEVLIGHTGHTEFTVQLMKTIHTHLNSPNNDDSDQLRVTPPAEYEQLLQCSTRDEMGAIIDRMSDISRSACLLYMLVSPQAQTHDQYIIELLAHAMSTMRTEHRNILFNCTERNLVNYTNAQRLVDTQSDLARKLSIIISNQYSDLEM